MAENFSSRNLKFLPDSSLQSPEIDVSLVSSVQSSVTKSNYNLIVSNPRLSLETVNLTIDIQNLLPFDVKLGYRRWKSRSVHSEELLEEHHEMALVENS